MTTETQTANVTTEEVVTTTEVKKLNTPPYLMERVRNKKGNVIGLFVAKKVMEEGLVTIGFSVVSTKRNTVKNYLGLNVETTFDKFDKNRGLEIALARCEDFTTYRMVPFRAQAQYTEFVKRCERYFKGCVVLDDRVKKDNVRNMIGAPEWLKKILNPS